MPFLLAWFCHTTGLPFSFVANIIKIYNMNGTGPIWCVGEWNIERISVGFSCDSQNTRQNITGEKLRETELWTQSCAVNLWWIRVCAVWILYWRINGKLRSECDADARWLRANWWDIRRLLRGGRNRKNDEMVGCHVYLNRCLHTWARKEQKQHRLLWPTKFALEINGVPWGPSRGRFPSRALLVNHSRCRLLLSLTISATSPPNFQSAVAWQLRFKSKGTHVHAEINVTKTNVIAPEVFVHLRIVRHYHYH